MRVTRRILQNLLRPAKRRLRRDDPVHSLCALAQRLELRRPRDSGHLSIELQSARLKSLPKITSGTGFENACSELHREKE